MKLFSFDTTDNAVAEAYWGSGGDFLYHNRPEWWGTWSKTSTVLNGRRWNRQDFTTLTGSGKPLNYDVDSSDEWEEEEEPGEELGDDGEDLDGEDGEEDENALDYGDGFLRQDDDLGSDVEGEDGPDGAKMLATPARNRESLRMYGPYPGGVEDVEGMDEADVKHVSKYRAILMVPSTTHAEFPVPVRSALLEALNQAEGNGEDDALFQVRTATRTTASATTTTTTTTTTTYLTTTPLTTTTTTTRPRLRKPRRP